MSWPKCAPELHTLDNATQTRSYYLVPLKYFTFYHYLHLSRRYMAGALYTHKQPFVLLITMSGQDHQNWIKYGLSFTILRLFDQIN